MMTSYTTLSDRKLRAMSNRTYRRILLSLQPEVARRYGYVEEESQLEEQVLAAVATGDWKRVAELSARLATQAKP
jgi:galactokinase